jgi:peptide/nickel transport system substrate-binding protein
LEQGRVLVDTADRTKRYRNFQVRFTNQMPALPMYYLVQSFALENQMQGVSVGTLFDQSDRFNTITNWYLVTKRPVAVTETQITSP